MSAAAPSAPQISGGAYLRLVGLGAAIGIPAALVSAFFLAFVHDAEDWLWHDLPDALGYDAPPWFLVVGLPVVGALIVVVARLFLPGDGGHEPLEGLSMAPTPVAHAPGIALAALGTLCFGAVLGPEAPVVALGSVVGMAVTLVVRLGQQETAVLSTAGSLSAISALFGGPLVAGMLFVEGGLAMGTSILAVLLPGLVAAAIGYLIFIGFGDWGGLDAPGLVVPNLPLYEGTHGYDLFVGVVIGILAAVVVVLVRRLATRVSGVGGRRGMPILLLAGGLAVGLIAQLADALGADSQDVLFSGPVLDPGRDRRRRDGEGDRHPDRRQVPRLRRQPRLRLPGRPDLPGHLPRHCARVADRGLVRRLADARGRGRHGRRHGGADEAPDLVHAPRGAPGRNGELRRRPRHRAGRSVGLDRHDRLRAPHGHPASPGAADRPCPSVEGRPASSPPQRDG